VQFGRAKKPLILAIFLLFALIFLNFWQVGGVRAENGVLGGPAAAEQAADAPEDRTNLALLVGTQGDSSQSGGEHAPQGESGLWLMNGGLEASQNSLHAAWGSGTPIIYKVKKGDTLSQIAADFGVSVQTIIGSNPEVRAGSLKIGQELSILPVSGILYSVREGETPESIAASFHLTPAQLKEFNRNIDFASFTPGITLIIPGISPLANAGPGSASGQLPNLSNYFVRPADGFNWGKLHPQNAVDIANACGTPVEASAEGLIIDASIDDWSYGYGHYIVIEHPNGTKTRYAHLDKLFVSIGDYVKQGEALGTMGQTGDATGCHLHFEVEGAKNPFAKL